MPNNQEYKGKGIKGRNYDELSGAGTSSAGKTGTAGNLNDGRANPGNSQQGGISILQQGGNQNGLSQENSGSGQRHT